MAPDFSGPFIFGKSTNSGEPVRLAALQLRPDFAAPACQDVGSWLILLQKSARGHRLVVLDRRIRRRQFELLVQALDWNKPYPFVV